VDVRDGSQGGPVSEPTTPQDSFAAKTEELERAERAKAGWMQVYDRLQADNDRLRAVMLECAKSVASGPLLPKQIAARLREEAGK